MAGRIETLIGSNRLRLALATGMAALGLWAFAPYVTSEVGGEAYVNAPIIRMASPIPGIVAADLPPSSTAIAAAITARLVTARSLDTGPLAALKGQQAALISARDLAHRRIADADSQLAQLAIQIAAETERLARRTNRSAEADAGEARLADCTTHELSSVDLIIATYNEPIEVLEKTMLGAMALDWPNLNVWVADDGRRT